MTRLNPMVKGAKETVIVNMSLFISEDVKRHRTLTGAWCVACVMATKYRRMYWKCFSFREICTVHFKTKSKVSNLTRTLYGVYIHVQKMATMAAVYTSVTPWRYIYSTAVCYAVASSVSHPAQQHHTFETLHRRYHTHGSRSRTALQHLTAHRCCSSFIRIATDTEEIVV